MQQVQPLVNLIITTGEPAGIGPEVSLAAAQDFLAEQSNVNVTLLGDASLLTIDPKIDASILERLNIEHSPLVSPVVTGVLNPVNAPYVLGLLDHAIQACLQGQYDAMVTAPIQKSVINIALKSCICCAASSNFIR